MVAVFGNIHLSRRRLQEDAESFNHNISAAAAHLPPGDAAGAGGVRAARPLPANSAYLLFAGRVAAGSPALGEEGFAPAGSIFAAGVLAFAAAVPAVAFSPLGVDPVPVPAAPPPAAPPPAAPPGPAASNDETGAIVRASTRATAHILISINYFLLVLFVDAHRRDDKG
jgi:hypothetical protein